MIRAVCLYVARGAAGGAVTVSKLAPFTNRLASVLSAVRVLNSFAVFAATFVGGLLAGGGQLSTVFVAAASMSFGAAFGYALNDYYDAAADRVTRSHRPIPSGALSRRGVLAVSLFCLGVTLLLTLALPLLLRWTVVVLCLVVWLYSVRIKRTGFWGNLLVSLLAGFTLVFGALSAGHVKHAAFPALLAFLVHLPREVLKDVQDVEGDVLVGGRSIASALEPETAVKVASLLIVVLAAVALVPYVVAYYNHYYFAVVLVLDALLLWLAATLWMGASGQKLERAVRILKFTMLVGLAAVGLGRL
ncbi:MAG: UbiA family prenyltransferase [Candidatus Eiseniibacteriota bacterium]|nr:MAG: UbiA family prenyltransferase [Candidatus Eisenbacteria bacterium]